MDHRGSGEWASSMAASIWRVGSSYSNGPEGGPSSPCRKATEPLSKLLSQQCRPKAHPRPKLRQQSSWPRPQPQQCRFNAL
ncbi:hypothetical protein EV2_000758 [Malus domestica]